MMKYPITPEADIDDTIYSYIGAITKTLTMMTCVCVYSSGNEVHLTLTHSQAACDTHLPRCDWRWPAAHWPCVCVVWQTVIIDH